MFDAVDRLITIETTSASDHGKPDESENDDDSQTHIVQSIKDLLSKVTIAENTTSNFSNPGVNLAVASFNLAPDDDSKVADDVLKIFVKEEVDSDNAGTLSFEKAVGKDDGSNEADVSLELETGKLLESGNKSIAD